MTGGRAKEEFERFVQKLVRPQPERVAPATMPAQINVTVNAPRSCRIYIGTDGIVRPEQQDAVKEPPGHQ